mmetsp:Transcript_17063/g.25233  ORF Transcript_17063/g.25233 Transcript_17063/m.25233 type:complete len:206 (+) Transcript_17063:102-719(+)
MTARYKVTVEYLGTTYKGVVYQPGLKTVSSVLQRALGQLAGPVNVKPIQWSSRTDSGVHATGNVFHVDITRVRKQGRLGSDPFRAEDIGRAVNFSLQNSSEDVQIVGIDLVPDIFHARHNAIERTYLYKLIHPLTEKSEDPQKLPRRGAWHLNQMLLNERGRSWQCPTKLDISKMREATNLLKGIHDFSSFRGSECVMKSPIGCR